MHPNSLANLRPNVYEKGNPGGPGRPPNAGRTINEHRNDFAGMTEGEIQAIGDDKSLPIARRTAAREWLKALAGDKECLASICANTNGYPVATNVNENRNTEHVRRVVSTIRLPSPEDQN